MTNKNYFKKVIKIAWPAVLESVFISLAGIIDTLMVSEMGPYAISAVGLTIQPKYIGLAFFLAINIAISSLIARRYGENKKEEANTLLLTALMFTIIIGLAISFLCVYYADDIIHFCGSNTDSHKTAVTYFSIIMGGSLFNAISLVINAALRGIGNTKIAMRTNVVSSLVNVLFNYLLITGRYGFPALGIKGAAYATVLGTIVAMIMSFASLFTSCSFLNLPFIFKKHLFFSFKALKSILHLANNFLLENLAMRIGFVATAIFASRLGTEAFAAHQVGMNILSLGFAIGDGMQVSAVSLIGYSLGQKKKDEALTYGKTCQKIGFLSSLLLAIALFLSARSFFGAFFPDQEHIIDICLLLSKYIMIIVLFQVSQTIFTGCLRGAGDVTYTLITSLISVAIVRTIVTYILSTYFSLGIHSVWLGVLADQCCRFAFNGYRFYQGKWVNYKI